MQTTAAITLLWLAWVGSASAFSFKILPAESMTVSTGKSALLKCEIIKPDTGRIRWLFNNREITARSGRVYIEADTSASKLYITPIEKSDAGSYTCEVNVANQSERKNINIAIYKDITFDHAPNPQHPEIYKNAIIACHVSGSPKPVISWRKDDQPIPQDGRFKEVPEIGLSVTNITQLDNGNYSCRAEVAEDGRYDQRVIIVKVHIPPVMKHSSQNTMKIEHNQDTNATLKCHASGLPAPKYEFFKNKQTLASSVNTRLKIDTENGMIHFLPLKKEDNGTYTCKAFNDVGVAQVDGSVRVFVPPNITELKNLTKSEKENATIICRSDGDPNPSMVFNKHGRHGDYQVGKNDGNRVIVTWRNNYLELHIINLQPSDTGNYTCRTSNSAGSDKKTASLIVQYEPRFTADNVQKVYSWPGRTHNISCLVQAYPTPSFKWLHNSKELNDDHQYTIYNSENVSNLRVSVKSNDVGWSGPYICQATNSVGKKALTITLDRAVAPERPAKVVLKEASTNMIILSVDPPQHNGGVEVIGYRVEYENKIQDFATGFPDGYYLGIGHVSAKQDNRIKPEVKAKKGEELRLENLKDNTMYSFRIRAKTEVGIGNWIMFNTSTTDFDKPSPLEIISSKDGSDSYEYTVIWATPKTGGKPITKYHLKYRKYNAEKKTAEEAWNPRITVDNPRAPLRQMTLHNLQPLTTYQVEIIADNEKGSSSPNKEFIFKTSDVRPLQISSRAGIAIFHNMGDNRILLILLLLVSGLYCFSTPWTQSA